MEALNAIEASMVLWIQENLRTGFMDTIMTRISWLNNDGMIAIITLAVLLLLKRYRKVGVTGFFSLLLETISVNLLIKPTVMRPRPYVVEKAITWLGEMPSDYSFPSGHTACAFSVAIVMLLCMPKKWGIPATVLASLIAFSRLYNGVHYPTDVLVGVLMGILTSLVATQLIYKRDIKCFKKQENN